VLAAAAAEPKAQVARWLGICADPVRELRRRWCAGRVRRRSPMRSDRVVDRSLLTCKSALVKAIACTPTQDTKGVTAVAVVRPGRTDDHRQDLPVDIAGDDPPVADRPNS
jgi:hypothetical protein